MRKSTHSRLFPRQQSGYCSSIPPSAVDFRLLAVPSRPDAPLVHPGFKVCLFAVILRRKLLVLPFGEQARHEVFIQPPHKPGKLVIPGLQALQFLLALLGLRFLLVGPQGLKLRRKRFLVLQDKPGKPLARSRSLSLISLPNLAIRALNRSAFFGSSSRVRAGSSGRAQPSRQLNRSRKTSKSFCLPGGQALKSLPLESSRRGMRKCSS